MKKFIIVKTQFSALHCWPDCPIKEVDYLKNTHRHLFYVELSWEVTKDRQIEFIQQKSQVDDWISIFLKEQDLGSTSCEMIAERLLNQFKAFDVSVLEDNENGCQIYKN